MNCTSSEKAVVLSEEYELAVQDYHTEITRSLCHNLSSIAEKYNQLVNRTPEVGKNIHDIKLDESKLRREKLLGYLHSSLKLTKKDEFSSFSNLCRPAENMQLVQSEFLSDIENEKLHLDITHLKEVNDDDSISVNQIDDWVKSTTKTKRKPIKKIKKNYFEITKRSKVIPHPCKNDISEKLNQTKPLKRKKVESNISKYLTNMETEFNNASTVKKTAKETPPRKKKIIKRKDLSILNTKNIITKEKDTAEISVVNDTMPLRRSVRLISKNNTFTQPTEEKGVKINDLSIDKSHNIKTNSSLCNGMKGTRTSKRLVNQMAVTEVQSIKQDECNVESKESRKTIPFLRNVSNVLTGSDKYLILNEDLSISISNLSNSNSYIYCKPLKFYFSQESNTNLHEASTLNENKSHLDQSGTYHPKSSVEESLFRTPLPPSKFKRININESEILQQKFPLSKRRERGCRRSHLLLKLNKSYQAEKSLSHSEHGTSKDLLEENNNIVVKSHSLRSQNLAEKSLSHTASNEVAIEENLPHSSQAENSQSHSVCERNKELLEQGNGNAVKSHDSGLAEKSLPHSFIKSSKLVHGSSNKLLEESNDSAIKSNWLMSHDSGLAENSLTDSVSKSSEAIKEDNIVVDSCLSNQAENLPLPNIKSKQKVTNHSSLNLQYLHSTKKLQSSAPPLSIENSVKENLKPINSSIVKLDNKLNESKLLLPSIKFENIMKKKSCSNNTALSNLTNVDTSHNQNSDTFIIPQIGKLFERTHDSLYESKISFFPPERRVVENNIHGNTLFSSNHACSKFEASDRSKLKHEISHLKWKTSNSFSSSSLNLKKRKRKHAKIPLETQFEENTEGDQQNLTSNTTGKSLVFESTYHTISNSMEEDESNVSFMFCNSSFHRLKKIKLDNAKENEELVLSSMTRERDRKIEHTLASVKSLPSPKFQLVKDRSVSSQHSIMSNTLNSSLLPSIQLKSLLSNK